MKIYTFYNVCHEKCKFEKYADAKQYVLETDKPIKYTFGLGYRHPITHNKPIDKAEAMRLLNESSMTDIDEFDDYIHINQYHENDMW